LYIILDSAAAWRERRDKINFARDSLFTDNPADRKTLVCKEVSGFGLDHIKDSLSRTDIT
jgi:hypothetical protein